MWSFQELDELRVFSSLLTQTDNCACPYNFRPTPTVCRWLRVRERKSVRVLAEAYVVPGFAIFFRVSIEYFFKE